ncbi:hypothetical protein LR48_Vigan11g105200 [Vigna angularis]|uniref:Uncharacterized protein n=1 Tax=Phaseolus angularis TaxID=3914 RepID=A0A0L9VTE8_PHAAN|nr:hypothetical protein LR48_Vigan11g105200 [Vigna angularis]
MSTRKCGKLIKQAQQGRSQAHQVQQGWTSCMRCFESLRLVVVVGEDDVVVVGEDDMVVTIRSGGDFTIGGF